jgi:hypothetical protein
VILGEARVSGAGKPYFGVQSSGPRVPFVAMTALARRSGELDEADAAEDADAVEVAVGSGCVSHLETSCCTLADRGARRDTLEGRGGERLVCVYCGGAMAAEQAWKRSEPCQCVPSPILASQSWLEHVAWRHTRRAAASEVASGSEGRKSEVMVQSQASRERRHSTKSCSDTRASRILKAIPISHARSRGTLGRQASRLLCICMRCCPTRRSRPGTRREQPNKSNHTQAEMGVGSIRAYATHTCKRCTAATPRTMKKCRNQGRKEGGGRPKHYELAPAE